MSRMRVLQINVHLTSDGALVAVQEVSYRGVHKDLRLLQRQYIDGPGFNATPGEVLQAVADLFDLRDRSGGLPPT